MLKTCLIRAARSTFQSTSFRRYASSFLTDTKSNSKVIPTPLVSKCARTTFFTNCPNFLPLTEEKNIPIFAVFPREFQTPANRNFSIQLHLAPVTMMPIDESTKFVDEELQASSTVKKRRLKMNKHKYRKRRKRERHRSK